VCFLPARCFVTAVDWSFAKSKLEHQEERVRNRYRKFNICIAFALTSALTLLAQSDRNDVQRWGNFQRQSEPAQSLLSANLVAFPAVSDVSTGSDLPDAPSATKADASTGEPRPSPAIKKESQGAPVAASGGPLWIDRSVADRKYLALTGGMFGAGVANAELTLHCLKQHTSCNDIPPSLHSRAALYGIGLPAEFGVAYLTYYLKRKHSHMWYFPAAAVTGANIFFGYRAYHWTQDHSKP
jgi:hypothetical protein